MEQEVDEVMAARHGSARVPAQQVQCTQCKNGGDEAEATNSCEICGPMCEDCYDVHKQMASKGKRTPEKGHIVPVVTLSAKAGGGSSSSEKEQEFPMNLNGASANLLQQPQPHFAAGAVSPPFRQDHEAVSRSGTVHKRTSHFSHDVSGEMDTESDDDCVAAASCSAPLRPVASSMSGACAPRQIQRSDGPPLPPTLTLEELKERRSRFPIWEMANQHVDKEHHFTEPSKELNQLHRPMICNMSYWKGDELRTCIMARIIMILSTKLPKQEGVFGREQIPTEHGGGPWLAAARACFEPTRLVVGGDLKHTEVVIKGLTQLTKTPETICQAFLCFFAQGVLPIIMVRNRGGANVGTTDMCDGVHEMNRVISGIFENISSLYSDHCEFAGIKKTDFHLKPRCTSGKAPTFLDIHGNGNYGLMYPQVIISCTNVKAVDRMTSTMNGRQLGSNLQMSLIELLSGYRRRGDTEDANPHAPYIWELDAIPAHLQKDGQVEGGEKEFPKAAIALLFDEDDANRSSTGSEKTDRLLFGLCPKLKSMVDDMRKHSVSQEEGLAFGLDQHVGNDTEEEEEEEGKEFYKKFEKLQLRSRVACVYAYTATPITVIHKVTHSASRIHYEMIELRPGSNYIGYATERSQIKSPWLKKTIKIKELPNRVRRETFPMRSIYPIVIRKYIDPQFKDGDEMPFPFKTSTTGTISLLQKNADDEMTLLDPKNLVHR